MMREVEKIEKAVAHLSRKDLARFRAWYDEFEAKVWDQQFEEDVQAGKLDKLADEAVKDFHAGRCTEL
jgi:hypothetical protein